MLLRQLNGTSWAELSLKKFSNGLLLIKTRESRTPLEAHVVFLRMRCFGLSSDVMVSSCQLLSNSVNQCETTLLSLLLSFLGVTYV